MPSIGSAFGIGSTAMLLALVALGLGIAAWAGAFENAYAKKMNQHVKIDDDVEFANIRANQVGYSDLDNINFAADGAVTVQSAKDSTSAVTVKSSAAAGGIDMIVGNNAELQVTSTAVTIPTNTLTTTDFKVQDTSGNGVFTIGNTGTLTVSRGGRLTGKGVSSRFELVWYGGENGRPGLNNDIAGGAFADVITVDHMFEILGTNASADDVTIGEGGLLFTLDGADGDSIILLPHLDTGYSPWTTMTWGTDNEVHWECQIQTGAAITNSIIWAGLKETNTNVVATDDDQAYFRYENGVGSGLWQCVSSIAGTDTSTNSTVTVAASTNYHLKIVISSTRTASFYINGAHVTTTAALTDATDLIPYIGLEADGAAEAKTMIIVGQGISRAIGA